MQGIDRQTHRQGNVLPEFTKIGRKQEFRSGQSGAKASISLEKCCLPVRAEFKGKNRLVNLHPFGSQRVELAKDIRIHGKQALEQGEPLELGTATLSEVEVG